MARVIVGQKQLVDRLMVGLLTNGHVLLEGVPGLAKTLALQDARRGRRAAFPAHPVHAGHAAGRHRRHDDLQPARRRRSARSTARSSPTSILADEINRAPAKVQSALLEAMQERQVTLGDETYRLPDPFLVLATQNPIEQEGTYPLPEAQVDRFMLKVIVGYPNRAEERAILDAMATTEPTLDVQPVVTRRGHHPGARRWSTRIYVDDKVKDYIVDLVLATRDPKAVRPRSQRLHPVRRLAARHDQPDARGRARTPSCTAAATSRRRT